jgi:hypothetical protein
MKSWAHTYMAGSLLGTVLIVAALVAFIPLVSLKAPDELPTPGLGLIGSAGKGDVGVGAAVVAAAKLPETGGLNSNAVAGPSVAAGTVIDAARASGREPRTGGPGGAEAGPPARGAVAVSPVSIEVVTRNPGSSTSEGPAVPVQLPNATETGSAPVSTATDGEVGDPREPPPSTAPIDAGVGAEGPESLPPPERPESVPPPPSGNSTEGGDVSDCPEEGDEGEAAQVVNGDSPAGSALNLEP